VAAGSTFPARRFFAAIGCGGSTILSSIGMTKTLDESQPASFAVISRLSRLGSCFLSFFDIECFHIEILPIEFVAVGADDDLIASGVPQRHCPDRNHDISKAFIRGNFRLWKSSFTA
jgi:hypothetical protein